MRIIGIVTADQTQEGKTETNDRLMGVAVHSYDHQNLKSINEVSKTLLGQVEEFFISYNKQRGKKFKVTGTSAAKKAIQFVKAGIRAHRQANKK